MAALHRDRLGAWVWWLVALLALIGITILAAYLYYQLMVRDARVQECESLRAIADLKANQVARWRQERLSDVAAVTADRAIAQVAARFCAGSNAADRAVLLHWLSALRHCADCRSATLLDASFRPVLASGDEEKRLGERTEQLARQVWTSQEPWLSDLHRGADVREIHLDLITPMLLPQGTDTVTVGTLLLRIDPYRTLFPMLKRWPTPSPSGETLLLRREGDAALCINELRFRSGTSLALCFALTNTHLAVVRALGGVSVAQADAAAVDERGVHVLWAGKHVRDCPWYVFVRKDLREVDAPVQRQAILVNATVAGLVLAILAVIVALWRRDRYQADLERMAVKQHLDLWLRFANDIILLMDQDGRILEANERAVLSYGYKLAELLRMRVQDLLAPGDATEWHRHDQVYEAVHRRKDGQLFPVEVSARRMEIQGRVFYQHIVRDITERRHAERDRAAWKMRYELATAAAGQVTYEYDPAADVVLWGGSVLQVFGYSLSEIQGDIKIVHPEDLPELRRQFEIAVRTQAAHDFEFRVRHRNGSYTLVRDQGVAARGEDGGWRVIGMLTDISERRSFEDALHRSEERYRLLFEKMREGFALQEVVCDAGGKVIDCRFLEVNAAFQALLGRTQPQLVGHTILEILPQMDRRWIETFGRVALTGEPIFYQDFPTGHARHYSVTAYSPRHGQFAAIFEDVTEHRRLEAQLRQAQKFDAIGRLAGGVAHDFNNILTAIIGYTELLLDAPISDADARPQIEEIRRSSERAATLTRQLLAFSSRQPAKMQVLALNQIVGDMQKLLHRVIGEHIRLDTDLAPDLGHVLSDPSQMEQVVLNLTINARDAMPGGGQIRIRTANVVLDPEHAADGPQAGSGEHVLLEVADTGVGMSRDVLSHIFEPFFTTKSLGKGTGLGLATVYGIVRQSNGQITVDSTEGQGSTFRIYLPRHAGDPVPAAQPAEAAPPTAGGHETILVVEDEPNVRQLAACVLRRAGYVVLEAADGEQAQRIAGQHADSRIDLLFTDLVMPEVNGQTLAGRLRQSRPNLRVLYTSGYVREMPDKAALERGEVALLPKPYTTVQLTTQVRAILDRKPAAASPGMRG
jgi:PAS domain S-box-containing protein